MTGMIEGVKAFHNYMKYYRDQELEEIKKKNIILESMLKLEAAKYEGLLKHYHEHCLKCDRHKSGDQLYNWGLHTIPANEFKRIIK